MCKNYGRRLNGILLSVVLALFLVPSLYSQSSKDQIIEKLTNYQLILSQEQFSIQGYNKQISDLSKQIQDYQVQLENYKKELADSNSKSEMEIQNINDNLKKLEIDLALSKQDLEQSRKDLAEQERLYKESAKDLSKLKLSLNLYRNTTYIFGGIAVGLSGYLIGNKVLHCW